MQVNLDANLVLLRECHPLLKLAPCKGRVVIIGSKNVPAPGPGAAAYSASKAGLSQLARVAALEWGADGIRVNVLHPNQVFDTAIWTEDVLAGARGPVRDERGRIQAQQRAAHAGDQPRRRGAGRRDVRSGFRQRQRERRCRWTAATSV